MACPPGVSRDNRRGLAAGRFGSRRPHYAVGWRFYFEHLRLAAQGYVVLAANGCGSLGYGERFSAGIRGDWGGQDWLDTSTLIALAGGSHSLTQTGLPSQVSAMAGLWPNGRSVARTVSGRNQRERDQQFPGCMGYGRRSGSGDRNALEAHRGDVLTITSRGHRCVAWIP